MRLGVAALPAGCDPLVLLADQPWVTAETLARVWASRSRSRARRPWALPRRGVVGPPVLVHRSLRPQIAGLTGDEGARTLLRRYASGVVAVPAEGDEASDVDDVTDLQRARSAAADRGE